MVHLSLPVSSPRIALSSARLVISAADLGSTTGLKVLDTRVIGFSRLEGIILRTCHPPITQLRSVWRLIGASAARSMSMAKRILLLLLTVAWGVASCWQHSRVVQDRKSVV